MAENTRKERECSRWCGGGVTLVGNLCVLMMIMQCMLMEGGVGCWKCEA